MLCLSILAYLNSRGLRAYLPFEWDGGKDTVERALAVGGHQHQVLPALVDIPHLPIKHQRSLTGTFENLPWQVGRRFAHLALGGEAEPGDDEVEVGLAEAVRHGTARGEDDGVAVARVGGE